MNETATNGTIQVSEYVKDASALMREYTDKLTEIAEASRAWIDYIADEGAPYPDPRHPRPQELANFKQYLFPAIGELIRNVSGMHEHGRVDGLEKIKLRLQLADLEAALGYADSLISEGIREYADYFNSHKSNRKKKAS
ncbi:MAG: hypothetical protein KF873_00420 [Gemmataceae bacterium]|nr:hypothetical protein [Planctomycetia bacterium]MBX3397174.1 hypothetical protein [Gemmataceae bacterium]